MTATPSVQQLGDAVLLQGPAVADAAFLVGLGLRALRCRDGVAPRSRWIELHRSLHDIAAETSADCRYSGNTAMPELDEKTSLVAETSISTREAATILRLKERQVRNLADQLGAQRVGRALLFDRGLVMAEALRRQTADKETG